MYKSFVSFLFKTLHDSYTNNFGLTALLNTTINSVLYIHTLILYYSVNFETQKILIQNQNSVEHLNYFKRMDS